MLKRAMDLIASSLGLIILSPLFFILGLAIRFDSRGSIFYRAKRIGQDGKIFTLYKFRTMVANADKIGAGITTAVDQRITRVGKLLRRTKLDELPQLINVLLGTMSLVGPRPEDPRYVEFYTDEQRRVLTVKPGITSLASVEYRNEEALLTGDDWRERYINEIMPTKLALDLQYVANPSLIQDIIILWKTFVALWR